MEFRNLQTFLKISELKSFSKAANELQYAQSTVTMQIKQLENELGFPLFDRIGKQVALTEKGLQFRTYAEEIYRLSEQAKDLLSEEVKPSGKLRIGAIESICAYKFEKILQRYYELYPDVSISVTTSCTDNLLELLKRNKVDMIYTTTANAQTSEYEYPFQTMEPIRFLAYKDFVCKTPIKMQDLMKQRLILTEETCSYRQSFSRIIAEKQYTLVPAMELSSVHTILELVKRNMGITLLPIFSAEKEIREGSLKVLEVEDFDLSMYRQLIYRKDKWLNLQMKKFIEVVSEIG